MSAKTYNNEFETEDAKDVKEYLLNGYEQCSKVFYRYPTAIKAVYHYKSDKKYQCGKTGEPTDNSYMLIMSRFPKDPECKQTYKKLFSVHPDYLDDSDLFDSFIMNPDNHATFVTPKEFIATAQMITRGFTKSATAGKCAECQADTHQIFKSMYKKDAQRPIYKKYWCTDCSGNNETKQELI